MTSHCFWRSGETSSLVLPDAEVGFGQGSCATPGDHWTVLTTWQPGPNTQQVVHRSQEKVPVSPKTLVSLHKCASLDLGETTRAMTANGAGSLGPAWGCRPYRPQRGSTRFFLSSYPWCRGSGKVFEICWCWCIAFKAMGCWHQPSWKGLAALLLQTLFGWMHHDSQTWPHMGLFEECGSRWSPLTSQGNEVTSSSTGISVPPYSISTWFCPISILF